MIFLSVDGQFGGICTMDVQWSVLEACLFGSNEGFNIFESFVVEFMEERFEAAKGEPGAEFTVGMEKLFFGAILDGNRTNVVGVVVVEDDKISMAVVGYDGKLACLIGEEVAFDFVDGHENARVVGFFGDILHWLVNEVGHGYRAGCWSERSGLCGSNTLPVLVHETLLQFCGDGDVAESPLCS
jgi:hypothetical protein